MATITYPGMTLTGTHAGRPAASAVGKGTIYACSDHGLIYQSDGSAWGTWFTGGSGDIASHLADAADAHDASAISVLDTAALFTATDVEGVLAEIGSTAPSLGAWTNYTPTLTATTTNPTLGSSTVAGRYKALDNTTRLVQAEVSIVTGGAWNAGSGEWKLSLPAGVTNNTRIAVGSMLILDNGVGYFAGACMVDASATVIHPMVTADDTANRIVAHNKPVTWATGDRIRVQVITEDV